AGTEAGVSKRGVAIVLIESVALVGEIGDDQVGPAVIVVIGEVDAHAGISAAVAVDGYLRRQTHFFKRAITLVVVEELDHGVVGDKEIDVAIAIVVRQRNAESFASLRKANFLGDFGEMAVSIIVVDQGRNRLEDVGMAIGAVAFFVLAAPDVFKIPLNVSQNDEIEQAIAIQIDPGGTRG